MTAVKIFMGLQAVANVGLLAMCRNNNERINDLWQRIRHLEQKNGTPDGT